jgi:drug/metabolite transporter (DMT)-like permease
MQRNQIIPVLQAILAAVLFGSSAPLSKILLNDLQPITLAGLLYLGSGLFAILFSIVRKPIRNVHGQSVQTEAGLRKPDLPWLAGAIMAGGILGPILLLVGLQRTPASTAALLLNFESVATVIVAAFVFKEAIGKRIWWAIGLIAIASIILSWNASDQWGISLGAFAVLGACLMWGIDNNLTCNISAKDPMAIVMVKGFVAGGFSLALSLLLGYAVPGVETISIALLVGSLCYGASISLFVLALRNLGAARTGTLFATAPFVGVLLSFLFLREILTLQFLLSLPLMLLGTWFLLTEDHGHAHTHERLLHEHCHQHNDQHHEHNHIDDQLAPYPVEEHSHWHRHDNNHSHDHVPDIHHRHDH